MNNPAQQVYSSSVVAGAVPAEEIAIVQQARHGDQVAFGELVRRYQRRAYAVAYSLVGNRDDALELAQDAFARAYRAMHRFEADKPFYPWLYRIVKNTCLNHLKKRRRHGEVSLDGMMEKGFDACSPTDGPEQSTAKSDLRRALLAAMKNLSQEHREILLLRHFQELSYGEIAECLDIPQGTVMSRLHAARRNLRQEMAEWIH